MFFENVSYDLIRKATVTSLDTKELAASVCHMDSINDEAGFNNEAKYGFLHKTVIKVPSRTTFATCVAF